MTVNLTVHCQEQHKSVHASHRQTKRVTVNATRIIPHTLKQNIKVSHVKVSILCRPTANLNKWVSKENVRLPVQTPAGTKRNAPISQTDHLHNSSSELGPMFDVENENTP